MEISFHFCMWHDGVYTHLLGTALRKGVTTDSVELARTALATLTMEEVIVAYVNFVRQLVECVH